MLRVAIVVGVAGLLAGCATPSMDIAGTGWAKPAAGVQQVTQDEMTCARAAQAAPRTSDLILGGLVDIARATLEAAGERHAYERCMTERGYRPAEQQPAPA